MTSLILTQSRASGVGTENVFETIVGNSGSVTAIGTDLLNIVGGTAISTVAEGSPNTLTISVIPSDIKLEELGNIELTSSPESADAGDVLLYSGSPSAWRNVPSSTFIQNVWTTFTADIGSSTANTTTDTLAVVGGTAANTAIIGDTLTINVVSNEIDIQDLGNVSGIGSPEIIEAFSVLATQTLNTLTPVTANSGSPCEAQVLRFDCDSNTIGWEPVSNLITSDTGYNTITDGVNTALAITGNRTIQFAAGTGVGITVAEGIGSPPNDTVTIANTAPSPDNLEITIINGQPMLTFLDTTRGSPGKQLSVTDHVLSYSDNSLGAGSWVEIGNAVDADAGYIVDFDGTIVFATGTCTDTNGNSKEIHLFVNGSDEGSIGTLVGAGVVSFVNVTLNVNINQGDRIRLQAQQGSGGIIEDTVVKLTIKWRG